MTRISCILLLCFGMRRTSGRCSRRGLQGPAWLRFCLQSCTTVNGRQTLGQQQSKPVGVADLGDLHLLSPSVYLSSVDFGLSDPDTCCSCQC